MNSSKSQKTIDDLLVNATQRLSKVTDSPRLDAEVLLTFITGFDKSYFITHPNEKITEDLERRYLDSIERRSLSEPVAYITGSKEFYGYDFEVNPSVLIPRPETELIVDEVLKLLKDHQAPIRLLDLGVGSGCITCAIILEAKKLGIEVLATAVDISSEAIKTASKNAKRLGVDSRITFKEGSWFDPLTENLQFHVIASNPPYIALNDPDVGRGTDFEPKSALYAAKEGLADIELLLAKGKYHLAPSGVMFIEFGHGQYEAIKNIAEQQKYQINSLTDLSGKKRVAVIRCA